ncbi:uncharacterized protein ColSpa_11397 [Colletotrichum spaethianum]|uniref:Uncharacterized protein n=1 Tax=Colletotrichum spaethianum TaxID=700344 RepID=A0AA37PF96_9PEZI|nr:uncharacterized protein ColSpa_11397 [Colletotrichum spaethianum]GKT51216.1 hypothetical protein ColSpa_11397 [Colletotrichum spaethianum]
MRSFVTCTVLASVASVAVAQLGHPLFEYPSAVPVEKRQEPGTPQYQCHEDCGLLITLGRQDGYCDSSEWTERYGRCMTCANEYSIWRYYSSGVTSAASKCGLTPVPSPSGAAAETTAAPATTSAAPAPATTAAEPATTSTSTAATPAEESSSSAAAASSSSATGVPATTLSTQASTAASGTASGAATTSTGAAGTSAATATRVHSIGTSVVIPSGTPTPSTVFAGAGKNAAAAGLVFAGMVLAAF